MKEISDKADKQLLRSLFAAYGRWYATRLGKEGEGSYDVKAGIIREVAVGFLSFLTGALRGLNRGVDVNAEVAVWFDKAMTANDRSQGEMDFETVEEKETREKELGDLIDEVEECETCGGRRVVSVPWPSGYPHAAPCPACRPGEPCGCGAEPGKCPTRDAFAAWSKEHG